MKTCTDCVMEVVKLARTAIAPKFRYNEGDVLGALGKLEMAVGKSTNSWYEKNRAHTIIGICGRWFYEKFTLIKNQPAARVQVDWFDMVIRMAGLGDQDACTSLLEDESVVKLPRTLDIEKLKLKQFSMEMGDCESMSELPDIVADIQEVLASLIPLAVSLAEEEKK